ncbi:flagellar assembly protein FliH [Oxalobacteraceae bacterium CAVE-383]|nr:flagellar assembly protein FliH [Oxalobacteraceae bacterium CAVE-383]
MNSRRIPKEQMTPYQRWEMASFDEDREADIPDADLAPPEPVIVPAVSEEEIAAIREQAHTEAYEEGLKQGHAAGYAAGARAAYTAGAEQNAEVLQQLRDIAVGFTTQVAASGETIAPQLLDLALDVAKAMLKTALPARPELVLPIVTAAMHALPGLQLPATLSLHPADAELVREHIGEDLSANGWLIAVSGDIERGSCRVDNNANQIDGSSATRWRRVAASLSKESDWLA